MQHTLTQPVPTSSPDIHTERGAFIRELKQAYEAGELFNTVTTAEISEMLISALFEEVEPISQVVH